MTDVVLDIRDGVAVITLDGAANRNALDTATAESLIEACEHIDADRSVGAAIVRGANGTFCSGADRAILRRAGEDPAEDERYSELGLIYTAFHRFGTLGVPTLAAATGAAVGAGVNLLLAADVAVVADDLRLIAGFTRAGIHPGGGNLTLLARRGGRTAAGGLGLFDQEVDGRRAVELGLAWEAVAADAVDERALAMARHVAADPALARRTALTMRTELSTAGITWEAAIDLERAAQMWSLRRRPPEVRPGGNAAGRTEVRP